MIISNQKINITKYPTNIYGLTYLPQMADFNNDEDWSPFTIGHSVEVSPESYNLVGRLCSNFMTHGILEIGVSRNGDMSFTHALLSKKPDNIPYIGIDIEDKTYLDDKEKNIHTIKAKSEDQEKIRTLLKQLDIKQISILFIDGWHSVNAVINDWKYADLLSEKSIVFFHDTNSHPGPTIILESIDTNIFSITKYFTNDDDYGLATAIKKL